MSSDHGPASERRLPDGLSTPERQRDPFEWYDSRRDEGVRYDDRRDCWDVFGYDRVERVLQDHETFSSRTTSDTGVTDETLIGVDPPVHDRLRSAVETHFTPAAVERLRPRVERFVTDLASNCTGDRVEFVSAFAHPLPMIVTGALLGVPTGGEDGSVEWTELFDRSDPTGTSDDVTGTSDATGKDDTDRDEADTGGGDPERALATFFAELVERRRRSPQDDLLTELATADDLTRPEIARFCVLLLSAGSAPTTNLLTTGVWTLVETGWWSRLRAEPSRVPSAVEELLRYRSPIQCVRRTARTDVDLGEASISAGDTVTAWIGSANRDPAVFDRPDTFRPDREPNRHLAFGAGRHFCLGAPLVRLQTTVALRSLLEQLPRPTLVDPRPEPVEGPVLYGLDRLELSLSDRSDSPEQSTDTERGGTT